MKKWIIFGLLLVALAVSADETEEVEDTTAPECDPEACQLPDCRCSSAEIPGGLNPREIPQFVTLTFGEAVNINSIFTFRSLLYNRFNTNGCPAGATFFVNHEYNNYQAINELYNRGFEIGLHSISRQAPQSYWINADYDVLVQEFAHQKVQMAHFANIPFDSLKGMRLPFLQMTGDRSFLMMANNSILYDSSWPTIAFTNPPLWPYTLDYRSTQDCIVPPCPESSIPGPWVLPIITWSDLQGIPCTFVDTCFWVPSHSDENAWFNFFVTNFERHYLSNRAPFPINLHEWFLSAYPAVRNALDRFLNLLNNLNDVYMVNSEEVIEWVRNPVTISEYRQKTCRNFIATECPIFNCGPYVGEHNNLSYWLQLCNVCPNEYPWVGNPLGQ